MNSPEKIDEFEERVRKTRDYLRRHKVARFTTKLVYQVMLRQARNGHPLKNEDLAGFYKGAIIENPLLHPQENEWINLTQAQPGRYAGYDFLLPEKFTQFDKETRERFTPIIEGRLGAFVLDQIIDNEPDDETPNGFFSLTNFDQVLSIDFLSPQQLLELGMLRQTSYQEAYKKVGLYDKFGEELKARRVAEDPVYQITPKGNTLVVLFPDSGRPNPRVEPETSLELAPIPRHI